MVRLSGAILCCGPRYISAAVSSTAVMVGTIASQPSKTSAILNHLEPSNTIFPHIFPIFSTYFPTFFHPFPRSKTPGQSPEGARSLAHRGPVKPSMATAAEAFGTRPGCCDATRGTMRCSDCGWARIDPGSRIIVTDLNFRNLGLA